MYTGKSYNTYEFLYWTRRSIFRLILISAVPILFYQWFRLDWLMIPWSVVALVGTAAAFIIGFKSTQTYGRTWEARQNWGTAMSASRAWCMMCKDYIEDPALARRLIYRHLAWITALRYQLRKSKPWETIDRKHNREYQKQYSIPERESTLTKELHKYVTEEEIINITAKQNPASQVLSLQGRELENIFRAGIIDNFRFMEMHSLMRSFAGMQGANERIKNFPYPRQYVTVSNLFVNIFCLLLPFSLLQQFSEFSKTLTGNSYSNWIWLTVPFSVLISWIYRSLDQVSESTENPFEGGSNDVPISQMSRAVEIEIREMLEEKELPSPLPTKNNIIL